MEIHGDIIGLLRIFQDPVTDIAQLFLITLQRDTTLDKVTAAEKGLLDFGNRRAILATRTGWLDKQLLVAIDDAIPG